MRRDYQAMVRRWSRLSARLNELEMPALRSAKLLLAAHLRGVKEAKRRQEVLTAERKRVTRELKRRIAEAREVVSRVHSLLRALLGPRDERLVRLGVGLPGIRKSAQKPPPAEGGKQAPPAAATTCEP